MYFPSFVSFYNQGCAPADFWPGPERLRVNPAISDPGPGIFRKSNPDPSTRSTHPFAHPCLQPQLQPLITTLVDPCDTAECGSGTCRANDEGVVVCECDEGKYFSVSQHTSLTDPCYGGPDNECGGNSCKLNEDTDAVTCFFFRR